MECRSFGCGTATVYCVLGASIIGCTVYMYFVIGGLQLEMSTAMWYHSKAIDWTEGVDHSIVQLRVGVTLSLMLGVVAGCVSVVTA